MFLVWVWVCQSVCVTVCIAYRRDACALIKSRSQFCWTRAKPFEKRLLLDVYSFSPPTYCSAPLLFFSFLFLSLPAIISCQFLKPMQKGWSDSMRYCWLVPNANTRTANFHLLHLCHSVPYLFSIVPLVHYRAGPLQCCTVNVLLNRQRKGLALKIYCV